MNGKITDSKSRLKEMMAHYQMNQTELCRRTGLQKSALSNYLNGDRVPTQAQISTIVDPFGINPAWFMGYDAPMFLESISSLPFSEEAMTIAAAYDRSDEGTKSSVAKLLDVKRGGESSDESTPPLAMIG